MKWIIIALLASATTAHGIELIVEEGATPLHDAVQERLHVVDIAATIHSSTSAAAESVNARTSWRRTPLHWAARYHPDPAVVELLVRSGADIDAEDRDGDTPLHLAVLGPNPAVMGALLNAGAGADARGGNGETPLHRAAGASFHPGVSAALIAAGAVVDARDGGGATPLHHAARGTANPAVIGALLSAGARLDVRDNDGLTPLHAAAHSHSHRSLKALLQAGADPNARDRLGRTALHLAALGEIRFSAGPPPRTDRGPFVAETMSLLIAAGADPSIPDRAGLTAGDHVQGDPGLRSAP